MFGAFTSFGKLGSLARAIAAAWTPSALWPTGTEPGMWISPSTLPASFNDYTGTTPVATPGTVADSSNPVGLALDIRAGAPETLGPEIIVGAPGLIEANWTNNGDGSYSSNGAGYLQWYGFSAAKTYFVSCRIVSRTNGSVGIASVVSGTVPGTYSGYVAATNTLGVYANSFVGTIDNISVKEVPGNHMLQSTSAARPLESAYDGQTLGPGNTYDATGYPIFQLYDGVDDGMATASFAAGTLINGMDCMIAVRRSNNLLPQILGLYQADRTKYFGVVGETSPNIAGTFGGCGTPTIFVNNVETANTRGDLFDAMHFGEWFILEYRGLDLSAWVNANFGNYSGYFVNGARGDIMLYPSTASTEDKDKARQYLADKYGVTLA